MRARRSLRLEATDNGKNAMSRVNAGADPSSYSPLTGTRHMSPSSAFKHRAAAGERGQSLADDAGSRTAEPETSSRGQSSPEENVEIFQLFSQVEGSLDEFSKMRQRLRDLKAEGGSRELGNLFGVDCSTLDLKTEMEKMKVLICEVRRKKQQQQRTGL
ncbi:hypothetical protein GDO78_014004 [Eleutherodactylus coqui]|uniref:Centromere protein R n=2 Tax=Eleutherodactylus coqui TaxID=57060 RepID=A0A8J6EQ60_ELECQ|nr:hypothetical protein GDO78_014004 [Eleutherodactylus coqui]